MDTTAKTHDLILSTYRRPGYWRSCAQIRKDLGTTQRDIELIAIYTDIARLLDQGIPAEQIPAIKTYMEQRASRAARPRRAGA